MEHTPECCAKLSVLYYAMRQAISGNEEVSEFTIHHRKSRRHPKVALTDLHFADDMKSNKPKSYC